MGKHKIAMLTLRYFLNVKLCFLNTSFVLEHYA